MKTLIIVLGFVLMLTSLCAALCYEAVALERVPYVSFIGIIFFILVVAIGTQIGTKGCVNGCEQVLTYENDRNRVKIYKDENGDYFHVVFGESNSKLYSRVYLDKDQVENYIEHVELAGTIDIE